MLRKEKALLTKNKIFEAGMQLIKEYGYDHVTISQICEKAGVAKGTFYVHYESKEDVIKQSYYSDMGAFIVKRYESLISNNNDMSTKEKIEKFLLAELMFTEYAGYEMTCRAFVTNLSECITEESQHFERRTFAKTLKCLLSKGIEQNEFKTQQSQEEIFLYLESFIRGFMASWCFANGKFNIVETGQEYIEQLLREL